MSGRPVLAPAAPTVLTGAELRALARARGWALPTFLLGDEPADDDPEHDVAAVRSLLARGVLTFTATRPPRPTLSSPAVAALAAFSAPDLVIEVDVDDGSDGERHVLVEGAGARIGLSEAVADVWLVVAASTLDTTLESLRPHPRATASTDEETRAATISASAHAWVDALVAEGAAVSDVAAALEESGVEPSTAALLAGDLVAPGRIVRVRVSARHEHPELGEGYSVDDVAWIEAAGRWWLVSAADDPGFDLAEDPLPPVDAEPETVSTFMLTTCRAVTVALDAVLPARRLVGA